MVKESPELLLFLHNSDLFSDLSPDQLSSLLPYLELVKYTKGNWLLREGEATDHLIMIRSGRAEVLKNGANMDLLRPGDWAGEMAHLEDVVRSASVRALEDTEVIQFSLRQLKQSPQDRLIYDTIFPRLIHKISARLRKTGDDLIALLKERLELTLARNQISKTIIYMMILFTIFFNIIAIYNNYADFLKQTFNLVFLPSSIFLFGTGAVRLIRKSGYPLAFYGITTYHTGKIIIQGILASIPIILLLSLIKWLAIQSVPSLATEPFFSFDRTNIIPKAFWTASIFYLLLIPIQELVVRGVLQSSFRNFFQGPHRIFHAILSSNILFEVLHIESNLFLAVANFALGIFWGWLYEYQKSLWGVICSHILIGWWGFKALDLLALLPTPGEM